MHTASRYIAGLILLSGLFAIVTGASADEAKLRDAIELLAAKSYSKTIEGADVIAASGVDHAPAILTALAKRRVYLNFETKTAAYRTGRAYFDFRSGKPLQTRPDGAKSVRVNNRVRSAIKTALGTLELRAKNPARRLSAAAEVFRGKNTAVLPALTKLIDTESDPAVKQSFIETRAALVLAETKSSKPDKLAAIITLKERGKQDALVALKAAAKDADPEIAAEAGAAVKSIEAWLAMAANLQNVWYGLSLGSVLLLAAIGLAITFGVMGVINMAHGEMVMLGAYTTFVVQEVFRAYAPEAFDLSLAVAIPLAFAVAGLVGIAIERGIIRFLYGRPLETLLATWGVSLFLQQTVRTIFGPTNREVGAPSYMSGGFEFLGLAITYNRLWIIVFTLVVFAVLLAVLRYTPLGLQMRAVTQNRRMAASMGIRTGYVDAMTFGLGSGIAGIAGVALSQIDNVSPNLGQNYIIDSFMVVVFGGVGNLWGTFVSALALGVTNKFLEPWAGAVLAKIVILVLLILFIQKRPRGLFALKGRAVEA
ncbi:MAG: urea ABC transporter permease subunit UrtB [Hyphomicrobiaceae bacterium]